MRRRALLSVVGSALVAGCGGRSDDDDATTTGTDAEAETTPESDAPATTTTGRESPLELADHELVRSNEGSAGELASVVGTVRNPTDEPVAEATATATFEDGDGETLDRASASTSDLSPDGSWSFELVYPGSGEDARAVGDYALDVEAGD